MLDSLSVTTPARLLVILALAASLTVAAKPAHANDDFYSVAYGELFATRLHAWTPLTLNGANAARNVVGLAVPGAASTYEGFGLGAEIRVGPGILHVFDIRYSSNGGGGPEHSLMLDGQPLSVQTNATQIYEFGFPSLGIQVPRSGDWKLGVVANWGGALARSSAVVRESNGTLAASSIQVADIYLRLDTTLCHSLAHLYDFPADLEHATEMSAACLSIAPIFFEGATFSGASLGVRLLL